MKKITFIICSGILFNLLFSKIISPNESIDCEYIKEIKKGDNIIPFKCN